MKSLFLVSVGATFGIMATTLAMADTASTMDGAPLPVESGLSAATCGDLYVLIEPEAKSWQDALANTRAHERLVQASWHNALADKRVEDRALAVAAAASECALTN